MRLAWKKSQKTLDTSKEDLKQRECSQRTWSQLCHYWDCRLGKVQVCVKYPGQVAPTTGSLILVPPRPKEEVFKVFEPKLVERILLPYDFINGTQRGGRGPILSGSRPWICSTHIIHSPTRRCTHVRMIRVRSNVQTYPVILHNRRTHNKSGGLYSWFLLRDTRLGS